MLKWVPAGAAAVVPVDDFIKTKRFCFGSIAMIKKLHGHH
jgi:hypothetical protein